MYPTYQFIDPRDYITQNETISQSAHRENSVIDSSTDKHTQSTLAKEDREYKP